MTTLTDHDVDEILLDSHTHMIRFDRAEFRTAAVYPVSRVDLTPIDALHSYLVVTPFAGFIAMVHDHYDETEVVLVFQISS